MAGHPLEYSPVPGVNPSGAPGGDRQQIATSAAMFGGAIAEGLGTLGHGLEKVGTTEIDAAAQQAQLDAQTHAAEVHSWQSEQTTKAQEGFLGLRGRAAIDALPDFNKRIREIHQEARDQAANQYTARLIDDQGRRLVDITSAGAARHAATERKTWETKTAVDSSQSYGNRAVLLATQSAAPAVADDITVAGALANSDNEVRNLFHGQGYEGPAIEAEVQKNRGRNVKAIVEQIAGADGSADNPSPGNVKRAFDYFKAQEEKIDAGSRVAISNFLRGPLNQIAGAKIADEALGRPPAPPKPEVIADVPANFIGAIKNTEGYRAKAYWDVNHYSIGYGTRANSPDEVVDQKQADQRFNETIARAARFVDGINPNLDPGTRAALISLTHNAGEGWGDSGLGAKIRAGDIEGAKELFLQYNKAGGETNESLVMRRAREASWFGRGDISSTEATAPHANKGSVMLRIMDDPQLTNRPQVQAAALARVNKIYQAWELQSATDKASFDVSVKNSTAEALSTGKVTAPLSHEQFIQNYGAGDGEKRWQDYRANVQLGSDIRATANLTPAEAIALRERYRPVPGNDFIAQQNRLAALDKAIETHARIRAETFKPVLQNATAEVLSTGRAKTPLSHEEFIMALGPEEGERAFKEYQQNLKLGSDLREVSHLSPDEIVALRGSYAPQPGEEFIAQQKRLAALDKAIASNEKAKADDPADYLIRRTEFGADAYKQFQIQMADKNATPEMRSAYAGMYAEKMIAEQLRLGISPDKVQIVPNFYIEQLNARLTTPSQNGGTLGVAQGIEAEAKLWGGRWPDVYRQLADKTQPVVRVIGSGIKPDAAQALVDLMSATLPEILKDQDTEKNAAIKKDVLDAFKPLAGSMGGQDGAISVFNDFRGQAEKLAARYVISGMTSRDAAAKAYDDLVGFKYTFQEGYRVPKDQGIDPAQVMAGASAVKGDIGKVREPSPDLPASGRIEKGNIDLDNRPVVKNTDGTISTVRSIGVNIDGRETLIPTVSDDGRIMSNDEAIEQYRRAGKHLGKFDSPDSATAYAARLHQQQDERYKPGRFDVAPARDTLGGLPASYLARATSAAYARDGKWVTSPDEKGLMLTNNDRAVRTAAGDPLIVSWRELMDRGQQMLGRASSAYSGAQP